jgi:hypothetical protein
MLRIMQTDNCLVLGIGALLSASAACGSTSDDGLTGRDISLADAPPAYAKAYCDLLRGCWGELLNVILPGEKCEDLMETRVRDELARVEQAIAAGKVRYDGSKLQACLDKLRTGGCANAPEPAECTAAVDGTVAEGAECSMSAECAGSASYCKTDASCPGRCAPLETAGGPCSRDSECAANLKCSQATSRCIRPAALGEACEAGAPECQGGLFCIGSNDSGRQGQCQTLKDGFSVSAGQPCLQTAPFCEPSLRCAVESVNQTTGVITTRCAQPVASGAPCQLAYPDVCPNDQYCAIAGGASNGRCTAKPGNGQPCAMRTQTEDPICAPNTRCDAGTCRQLQKLGGSCQTDAVCYSENCINGGCAPSGACE